jgi:2-polyprenyl-3-methyl-5-hydroxy-6-metoxy-1,4-benzoquinol methylase
LPATKTSTLRQQANQFQERLAAVKSQTPLDPRVTWYPWRSLGQMEVLDKFLQGDSTAFMSMIAGDRVLDVGCADGDIAFFLETLGVRVDAIDHAPTNYNALLGVHALKQKLGSSVRIHAVDLDTRPHLPSSNYGFTVMLGVLYHLKNPFLVLEALARASRYIFLSTRIASLSPDRKTNFGALPIAYLVEEDELNDDNSNFWIFSEKALQRVVRRSGWDVLHYTTVGPAAASDPVTSAGDARAFILAKSRLAAPPSGFRLGRGWHHLEYDAWRWTERAFSMEVVSYAPLRPATLRFVFQLPEAVFANASALRLSVRINGTPLAPGIYSTPGEHEYIGAIPSLDAGTATVEFELDRAIGPTDIDRRELGLLVDLSGADPIGLS